LAGARFVVTGYSDLDRLLCGGIRQDSAVMLTSPSCSERDLLVKRFLETGAKNGEATFYVTINPGLAKALADEYLSSFWLFVCNPQADAIVKDALNTVKLKGVENLTDISIGLTSAIRKLDPSLRGARRICLGLVSDVLLQHHAVQTRRWLLGLIPELQSQGFTVLAIMDPEMHPSQEARAILDLFDGEISIFEKAGEKGGGKYLKINKISNQKYLEDELPLKREEPEVKPQESAIGQVVLDKHRIAVLPFVSMSPDPNDEYFADGMTEEIISTVSGISGLRVISRTSVMGYKGTAKKVKEIGRELEVGSVLEGSLRKAGNRIRVTTQLITVAEDEHVWAQNYDKNLDDVFEVQSDIAKQVADALRVRILSSETERVEKRPTNSTEAYTSYLKGVYLYGKRMGENPVESVKEAAKCFEQAVREDPSFALGYVGLASCSIKLAEFRIEIGANLEKAKRMSAKALELDAGLAEAHSSNGWALSYSYDIGGAEDEFKKAIQLKPSDANAHNGYHGILAARHRWDEALEHIERAVELDPLSPLICGNYAQYLYCRGDYRRALELSKRAVDLGGSSGRSFVAFMYGKMKMFEEMRREYKLYVELRKGSWPLAEIVARADMAYLEDDKETLRELLPELETHVEEEHGVGAFSVAACYFYLGENDKGFEWLERSYSRKEHNLPWITVDPDFDGIRTDPRYLDLLKRLGLDQTAQPSARVLRL
jgi:TolB-like protein/tetratricopeptide (TPR) repeat protein/KaiC/GvpD/RAD55 family RecA-like ATPase